MDDERTRINRQYNARQALLDWAEQSRSLAEKRDPLLREAVAAGLGLTEVARLSGLNRQYLYTLLGKPQ